MVALRIQVGCISRTRCQFWRSQDISSKVGEQTCSIGYTNLQMFNAVPFEFGGEFNRVIWVICSSHFDVCMFV